MQITILFDPDHAHAERVVHALRAILCQTIVCTDIPDTIHALNANPVDVLIVVPSPMDEWTRVVERIRSTVNTMRETPQIVCLLRRNRGIPEERVYASRKGFVVIYER